MKNIYILSAACFFFLSLNVSAQSTEGDLFTNKNNTRFTYHDAGGPAGLGVRISPDGAGITAKFFIDPRIALDVQINGSEGIRNSTIKSSDVKKEIAGYGPGWAATGLLEYNFIFSNVSWRIYAGGGLHAGKWDRYNHRDNDLAAPVQGIFGVDGVLGAEYLFKRLPLGISAEVKPAWNFLEEAAFYPDNMIGASVRFYFGHLVPANGPVFR
jgi:hypothetical protein